MVLNNLNLDIPENALYGYLGNNGSGKTTTIQVLLGLARPVKGEVLYDGQPFRDQREKQLRKIGLCPENHSIMIILRGMNTLRI
ncbi:ATP-binding cassette domain-containing protein [Bacteroides fragilis]|nr:ATP-binding cassette domain-containing protein [Bacteroides fragilis]